MKRRTVIFSLFWAYVFNGLWVPGGLDEGYLFSVCFPAWPLFLLGLIIGGIHEALASRWLRQGVSIATIATLTYLCLILFEGHSAGFYLALPMVGATMAASIAATQPRLTKLPIVPVLGGTLLGISMCALLSTALSMSQWKSAVLRETTSPKGIYTAQVRETMGMKIRNPNPTIVVGPRRDITHWFWAPVGYGTRAAWSGNQNLYVYRIGGFQNRDPEERYLNVIASSRF